MIFKKSCKNRHALGVLLSDPFGFSASRVPVHIKLLAVTDFLLKFSKPFLLSLTVNKLVGSPKQNYIPPIANRLTSFVPIFHFTALQFLMVEEQNIFFPVARDLYSLLH